MADNEVLLKLITEARQAATAFDKFIAESIGGLDKLAAKHPEISLEIKQAQQNLQRLEKELLTLQASGAKVTSVKLPVTEALASVEQLKTKIAGIRTSLDDAIPPDPLAELNRALDRAGTAVASFADRTDQNSKKFGQGLESAATKARIALEALSRETQRAIAQGSPVTADQITKLDRLETEYRQATSAAQQFRAVQSSVRSEIGAATPQVGILSESVDRAAGAMKAFIALKVADFIRNLAQESIEASEKIRRVSVALESVRGSSDLAAQDLAFVREESKRLGLNLEVAADGFTKLSAGARDTVLEGQGIRDVFSGIAEKATVAGLSSEQFERIIKALSDSLSKGTLSAEELRQQLGDNLPDATNTLSRALKIDRAELVDLMSKGLIPATTAVAALARQYREDLGDAVEKSTDEATANINRLKTATFEAQAAFGDGFKPAVNEGSKALAAFLGEIAPILPALGKLTGAILEISAPILTIIKLATALGLISPEAVEASSAVDKLATSIPGLTTAAEANAEKIGKAIVEINKYAEALPKTGKIQREEADKIVKAIDKQLKAIRELPPAEEAAFKQRAEFLEQLREKYFQFTTEYEKESAKQEKAAEKLAAKEAKELARRTGAVQDFVSKFAEAMAQLQGSSGGTIQGPKIEGGSSEGLQAQIEAAREELANLESPDRALIPQEDIERADQLRQTISDLQAELTLAGNAGNQLRSGIEAVGASGNAALAPLREAILSLINDSKEFGAVFQALPPVFQEAIQGLLSQFLTNLSSGLQLGQEDIQRFIGQFTQLLRDGGAVTDEFATKLQALAGGTADTQAAFDALAGGASNASEEVERLVREGIEKAKAGFEESTGVVDEAGESYIRIARHVGEAGDAAAKTSEETTKLRLDVVEHKGAVEGATDGYIRFGDEIHELGKETKEAAENVIVFRGETIKIGDAAKEAKEGLEGAAEGVKGIAEGAEKAAVPLKEGATHLLNIAEFGADVKPVGENLEQVATAGDKASKSLESAAQQTEAATPQFKAVAAEIKILGDNLLIPNTRLRNMIDLWKELIKLAPEVAEAIQSVSDADKEVEESGPN